MTAETPSSDDPPRDGDHTARRLSTGSRGVLTGLVALVVVLAVTVGAATLWGRSALYATGLLVDGGQPTVDPSALDPEPTPVAVEPTLLPAPEEGTPVDAAALAEALRRVPRTDVGGQLDLQVDDVATGSTLHREGAQPGIPASTLKLLTGAAALHLLGPDHRFTTAVQRRGAEWVLVGGGDPLLTLVREQGYPERASLQRLAELTRDAVEEAGLDAITLTVDADLFEGPDWSPTWPENYRDQVTPVVALVHDQGQLRGTSPGPREPDPVTAAADRFAGLLEEAGVSVQRGGTAADGEGETVAEVSSPPVSVLVEQMLQHSDNDIAEILLRQAAVAAGEPATFEGGATAVAGALADLGVPTDGVVTRDGSGLSRENRLGAPTLSVLLRLALSDDHPGLRPLVTGLPLAGGTGSLTSRYADAGSEAGLGQVHGKTGTLRGTHSLAGYTRTADGRLLVFAFLVNDAANDYAARVWLDRASAAVAACGC
ncbi:D-alanyl-D-alanine carboxypeptidase/D-alanyl-D-alanine endopeptidase [Desertihabitans brevis]|uniref:D-alanyl-D-alanine carboxypeptidase/D-alanyl-D-alanine endopeptidase n=1 Tax=Desertihabitans brevis TaxID=2268447 RepID=UPI0013145B27|nr:D-alanyl-D-alanine carboxypeptidase/D-alanyl-D-alanine-endopeptidase [Desertihabitans brevis]